MSLNLNKKSTKSHFTINTNLVSLLNVPLTGSRRECPGISSCKTDSVYGDPLKSAFHILDPHHSLY